MSFSQQSQELAAPDNEGLGLRLTSYDMMQQCNEWERLAANSKVSPRSKKIML